MGAYKIRSNSLATNASSGVPAFSGAVGSLRFRHREYLGDQTSSVAFTNTAYNINPGLYQSFPFLSSLAANFQQYILHGLLYEFKSTSADALNSTNTALGTVIMATNYNSIEPIFTSKLEMEATEYSNSATPSLSQIHGIECDPRQTSLREMYVRTGAVPSDADQRFYDMGVFQIASVGVQQASNIGELWVSYDVTLLKPRLTFQNPNPLWAHITEGAANTGTAAAPLGTTGGIVKPLSSLAVVATTNTFTLPTAGIYSVTMSFSGANIAAVPSLTAGANLSTSAYFIDDSAGSVSCFNSGGTKTVYTTTIGVVTAGTSVANTVTIAGLTSATGLAADVVITQLPYFYTSPLRPSLRDGILQLIREERSHALRVDACPYDDLDEKDREVERDIMQQRSQNKCCCGVAPGIICTALVHSAPAQGPLTRAETDAFDMVSPAPPTRTSVVTSAFAKMKNK